MGFTLHDIPVTVSTLFTAFVVGAIAQFLRQKTDPTISNGNIWWLSVASGFSSMIVIGLLNEYTKISGSFLVSLSGVAGWAGIKLLHTLSTASDIAVNKFAEKKLDVVIERPKEVVHAGTQTDTDGTEQSVHSTERSD